MAMEPGRDAGADTPSSRLLAIMGAGGLARVRGSAVAVFGCGGVGSNCVEALARGGVGALALVDGDAVAASNINRQAIAFPATVGRRKVEVMREMVLAIDPGARVACRDAFALPADVAPLLDGIVRELGRIDYVVDAIDTTSTKIELAAACRERGIPLVSSMGGAMKLDPSRLAFADIFETRGDPLARVMRKACRRRGIERLEVLFSDEEPVAPPADAPLEDGRPVLGTASYMPPIMGQMLAGRVIRALAGIEVAGDRR